MKWAENGEKMRKKKYDNSLLKTELIEKNKPAKMRQPVPGHFECPQCLDYLNPMWDYCPWCGQRVEG